MTRNSLQRWWRRIFNGSHVQLAPRRGRVRLRLETFEDRVLPSVFVVTTTNETGAGSLYSAIMSSNSSPGPNGIDFEIGTGGPQTIALLQPLPTIVNNQVTIDGTSQPGWAGAPLIELLALGNPSLPALTITTSGCRIESLNIQSLTNPSPAVSLYSNDNVVSGDIINGFNTGVEIYDASGNVIGGTTPETGNTFERDRKSVV